MHWDSETSLEWRGEDVEEPLLCRAWLTRDEGACAASSESDWDEGAAGRCRERGTELRE